MDDADLILRIEELAGHFVADYNQIGRPFVAVHRGLAGDQWAAFVACHRGEWHGRTPLNEGALMWRKAVDGFTTPRRALEGLRDTLITSLRGRKERLDATLSR